MEGSSFSGRPLTRTVAFRIPEEAYQVVAAWAESADVKPAVILRELLLRGIGATKRQAKAEGG